MCWRNKCLIDGKLVMQCAPHSSRPKKKKVKTMLQPIIEEANEEAAEELTGKEMTPEEVIVKAAALEEVPIMNTPPCGPCLEELVWATLQEVHKMCESVERHEHFEYRIWEELRKLVTLKGREVSPAQGNVALVGVVQGNVTVGKSWVQGKGKRKARELEEEEETLV